MDSKADAGTKKKFVRKVAPSKAPGRVLKKQLRNMERLLKNKDTLKDLPTEVVAETEKKIADIKKKIEALGPQPSPASAAVVAPKSQINSNSIAKGGIKATGKFARTVGSPIQQAPGQLTVASYCLPTPVTDSVIYFHDIALIELRRAGRKIVAFKKQHPNHEASEVESKELAELELDLMYIKVPLFILHLIYIH